MLTKYKDFKAAQYRLADTLVELERYQDAVVVVQMILGNSARKNAAHQRLGRIYTLQERYDFAVREYRAALKHDARLLDLDPTLQELLDREAPAAEIAREFMARLEKIIASRGHGPAPGQAAPEACRRGRSETPRQHFRSMIPRSRCTTARSNAQSSTRARRSDRAPGRAARPFFGSVHDDDHQPVKR